MVESDPLKNCFPVVASVAGCAASADQLGEMKVLREVARLLRNPFERMELWKDLLSFSWPMLRISAGLYRRIFLRSTCIITVTGTYGKTTTARAITAALGMPVDRAEKSNNKSGIAKALLMTPPWRRFAVFEVGIMECGRMKQYARMLLPRVAVVNSIGIEHQRTVGPVETLRSEKAQILSLLPRDGIAILNGDDPNVLWMKTQTDRKVITYGFSETNDVSARNFQATWPSGSHFDCHISGRCIPVLTGLHGKVMVYPALAALAVVQATDYNLNKALSALEKIEPARNRMQLVKLPNGAIVIQDEYKSSPETMEAAIDFLKVIPVRRRILVLGEMDQILGSNGPVYRAMGTRLAPFADRLILLGNNARKYASGACQAGMERSKITNCGDLLDKAIEILQTELQADDVGLIKGRGCQHLERIALALQGITVKCRLPQCRSRAYRCDNCPMLKTGWETDHNHSAN
jgi:UDP-N-acetylmuramoyl-tripeptide--D-alanyl-D-alanine ligase